MDDKDKMIKKRYTNIAICLIIFLFLIGGGAFLSQKNKEEGAHRKDPYNILGKNIGQINDEYCGKGNGVTKRFYIDNRRFFCGDFEQYFMDSDYDNYILVDYSLGMDDSYFYFETDESETDQRPLAVDNPEQFVGQMATTICPKYSLADFIIFAAGEHMGISTIPCKDINRYSMYQDVIITDVYYGADEDSGDDSEMYYEENNAKETRHLYFDGEYINDRLTF